LCRLAFAILGEPEAAEEAVMDAFVRTYASWRSIRDRSKADAYIKRAVINHCRNRLRRRAIERRFDALLHRTSNRVDPFEELDLVFEDRHLWDLVRALPDRQRACIALRYVEDMTEPEIADVLQCSVGNVKALLSRGRTKLARALGGTRNGGDYRE
jgi:RNA polymerase sigma factor (sigma-70 family)